MEENKEINENEETINNETNNNQNLIPAKSNNGLVIGLVILVILLAGGLVYMLFFNKGKEEPQKNDINNTSTATPAPIENEVMPTPVPQEENDADKKYELTVYKSTDAGLVTEIENEKDIPEWIVPAFKIKVSTKDAKVIDADNDDSLFVLYDDNGLYIYDVKAKKSEKINLGNNYKEYTMIKNEANNKVIGIAFKDKDDYVGYYNVSLRKTLYYANKYKNDDYPYMSQIDDEHIVITTDKSAYLLSSNKEKIELSHKYTEDEGDWYTYWSSKIGNKKVYMFGACVDDCIVYNIYNDELKEFYSGELYENDFDVNKNSLYIVSDGTIKVYNADGNIIKSYEGYKNVKGMSSGYVVYLKDNYLVLENLDNPSESKQIMKWNNNYFYDYLMSGYYSREALDSMNEKNKKEGIYIVVYYGGGSKKDSNGNYGMEYCYTLDKQLIEYPIKNAMGGRAKPVLYLYPEKETNVIVKFEKPNLLTTTYPKYINSWNVLVKPNGDMKDCDGKYYYALYWDEKRYNEVSFDEGFYVEGKDAIKFLEEKLTIIGLNDKERNEFIMYWLPILEKNEKNLVYFELTEERELGNKLIITPKPDSLLRVSVHIKKVNEKINIKEQKLPTFKRVGFTAVEWGGMTY